MSFDDDEFTLDEAWGEDRAGGDRANDTLRREVEAELRMCRVKPWTLTDDAGRIFLAGYDDATKRALAALAAAVPAPDEDSREVLRETVYEAAAQALGGGEHSYYTADKIADSVAAAVASLASRHPGDSDYIRDEAIRAALADDFPARVLADPVEFTRLCLAYRIGWEASLAPAPAVPGEDEEAQR